ncbi:MULTISPECIES: GNAT family N-acetyltransferase [unclassified Plantibacter]|uniref:GNAT family N-acetyltransferase n=1 Tax=unclassified Plantibacter TaxID=2624265 RepID=UPI0039C8CE0A
MSAIRVEHLGDAQRADLTGLLDEVPRYLRGLIERPRRNDLILVAVLDHEVVGVLSGSLRDDLSQSGEFVAFSIPGPPHAYLNRVYVLDHARCADVGRSLVRSFLAESEAAGCSFVGGLIDQTDGGSQWRKTVFEKWGFVVDGRDHFGSVLTSS